MEVLFLVVGRAWARAWAWATTGASLSLSAQWIDGVANSGEAGQVGAAIWRVVVLFEYLALADSF